MPGLALYRAVWIPSALALVGAIFVFATQPASVAKPAPLQTYSTSDKAITLRCPGNWTPHETSLHAVLTELRFQPNETSQFSASADLQGSLMADIGRGGGGMEGLPGMGGTLPVKRKSPLEKLHDQQGQSLEKQFDNYAEGETVKTQVSSVDAIITSFTYQEPAMFGKRDQVGKRVTALLNDRRLSVIYHCAKANQAALEPSFDAMIASLHVGQGE